MKSIPGINNYNRGRVGINKDGVNKLVLPEELDDYMEQGWVLGQIQNHIITEEIREKLSKASKGRSGPMAGKHHSDKTKAKLSKSASEYMNRPDIKKEFSDRMKGTNNPFYGKHHTEETRKKLSEAQKGRTKSEDEKKHLSEVLSGNLNPMYGHKHSEESKQKMRDALKGRECVNKGKIWITNGIHNKMIDRADLEQYPGYHQGISRPKVNRIWINNGLESKMIVESDLSKYPDYSIGRLGFSKKK